MVIPVACSVIFNGEELKNLFTSEVICHNQNIILYLGKQFTYFSKSIPISITYRMI